MPAANITQTGNIATLAFALSMVAALLYCQIRELWLSSFSSYGI